jgi:hypothetical protein
MQAKLNLVEKNFNYEKDCLFVFITCFYKKHIFDPNNYSLYVRT